MTPREVLHDDRASAGALFSSQELVLQGRPNWPAGIFFAAMAALHAYIALHTFGTSNSEAMISAILAAVFLLVTDLCLFCRHQITISPLDAQIYVRHRFGKFSFDREIPFSAVRAIRVTLWQPRRGPQSRPKSRVDILCNGEELPCPPTKIPRQEALYLALVMKVRLIKISDDRPAPSQTTSQTTARTTAQPADRS
jgi:hypothetical protein